MLRFVQSEVPSSVTLELLNEEIALEFVPQEFFIACLIFVVVDVISFEMDVPNACTVTLVPLFTPFATCAVTLLDSAAKEFFCSHPVLEFTVLTPMDIFLQDVSVTLTFTSDVEVSAIVLTPQLSEMV